MKKKGAGDLTTANRLEINILLNKGHSQRSIANTMGRGHGTVSYEVQENSMNGVYDPLKADQKAHLRKRMRRFQWSKIEHDPALKKLVIEKLEMHWNPDEIAGWLKRMGGTYASKTAIYQWLGTARGERYTVHLYAARKHRKRKKRSTRVLIPHRIGIERRNRGASNRTRYRHWERDTMVGAKQTPGGIATHTERRSRLLIARKVLSMSSREHARVTRAVSAVFAMKSITMDNGIENREHEAMGVTTFFCDPYSSWQKGSVENANKMLRRYFPKGTDFRTVSQADIDRAVSRINNKPRRILGYRSALEVARGAGVILNERVLTEG